MRLGQHLARQGEVDGPRGLATGDGQGPVHRRFKLNEVAQLVVPLDELARHPALVEGLLCPVNGPVAAAEQAALGDGRAPRGEEDGHLGPRGVDEAAQRIGGAHDHVDHHRLRLARNHGVAMGHGDRRGLVRHRDGLGAGQPIGLATGIGLDQGREVRPRIGEEIVHPARGKKLEIGVGGALDGGGLLHARLLVYLPVQRGLRFSMKAAAPSRKSALV